jgi:hypothetical protein
MGTLFSTIQSIKLRHSFRRGSEAGIFGIGMNSKKSAGVLRDSNSFRLKYERKYRWLDGQFVPGIEIFHTHREYFASKLVATKAAFMIDEISTGLTLSYIWDTK